MVAAGENTPEVVIKPSTIGRGVVAEQPIIELLGDIFRYAPVHSVLLAEHDGRDAG